MGLDLHLLPFDADHESIAFSHTVLSCDRCPSLFCDIFPLEEKSGVCVPAGFNSYVSRDDAFEEPHYGTTIKTPYGEKLKYVLCAELVALEEHSEITGKNIAIWQYLKCLDPATKVALFWH